MNLQVALIGLGVLTSIILHNLILHWIEHAVDWALRNWGGIWLI
jgi:hypothetical protein